MRPDRPHLLVLYVGGTIGMEAGAGGLVPSRDLPARLAVALADVGHALPRFDIEALADPIDSAEASPADWVAVARLLAERWGRYDGFVVLHGTDTLAYTASALSFMLGGIDRPVVLTGSQVPLGVSGSDAIGNVASALAFAARGPAEVGLAFDGWLYRGNRATKMSSRRHHAFDSPNCPPLDGGLADASAPPLPPRAGGFEIADYGLAAGRVAALRVVPGLSMDIVEAVLQSRPAALILACYGAGTVPSLGGALPRALRRAGDDGLAAVAISQAAHGGVALDTYATGAVLLDAGVVGGGDMTFEATFAKLHHFIAHGLSPQAIRARIALDLAGEVTMPSLAAG